MDNLYLLDLINEANSRGGGFVLNFEGKPAVVVLTVDRYNGIINQESQIMDRATKPKGGQVLVTGGAGYIGGHLVRELVKAGYQVTVLDNLATGRKENLDLKAAFIEGDLGDLNLLRDIFAANKFEAVFHMAASLEVEESVREPQKYFRNNVINLENLLSAMQDAGVKKIIFSSSAAVYGEPSAAEALEDRPGHSLITESSPLHPNNPYGATKLLGERVIKYYCQNLGFQAVVFRYFNACGFDAGSGITPTHQSHLIYKVMEVAKGSQPYLRVFGNDYPTFDGTCVRDYVHVLDIVLPHILALEKMTPEHRFEIYNIGTGHGYSVAQIVNSASEVLNKIIPMEVGARRPGDAPESVADNKKLLNELGYKLQYSGLENILKTSWEVMKDI